VIAILSEGFAERTRSGDNPRASQHRVRNNADADEERARGNMSLYRDPVPATGSAPASPIATDDAASRTPLPARAGYVPEVDALRGLAMTSVIIFHCKLMPFGWMGVWAFYVVSGFAVTSSVSSHTARGGWAATVGGFYLRRAMRIWPLYFAFLAANVVVLQALGWTAPLASLPWLVTFTQNINMLAYPDLPQNGWPAFGHLWTLSVEQQFYLLFPMLLLLRSRRAFALALTACVVAAPVLRLALGIWFSHLGWNDGDIAFAIYAFAPTHFDAFAIGALIALFRAEIRANPRIMRAAFAAAGTVTFLYVGVYAALGLAAAPHVSMDALRNIVSGVLYGQGREVFVYMLPTGISAAIIVGILCGQASCLRLCRVPGLQMIGRVSYGGYLLHIPVLMALGAAVPIFYLPANNLHGILAHIGLFLCAYPVVVALAWLSFTFFERPVARLGTRLRVASDTITPLRHAPSSPTR
jgi:peptidoglycan/LPS O-acetylase OafA/YrhL